MRRLLALIEAFVWSPALHLFLVGLLLLCIAERESRELAGPDDVVPADAASPGPSSSPRVAP